MESSAGVRADAQTFRPLAQVAGRKWWIAAATVIPGVIAWIYCQFATPVFQSVALVGIANNSASSSLGSLSARFGRIAELAGVPLPPAGADRPETIAVLRSRMLAEEFISQENLRPLLFPSMWDEDQGIWRRQGPLGPGLQRAVRRFFRDVLSVEEDPSNGLVKVRVQWHDPALAAQWANKYVALANRHLRERAIDLAAERLAYLRKELDKGGDIELRRAIYDLIQQELNTSMIANVQQDFALRVVDPALVSDVDMPVWPKPVATIIVAALAGFALSLACVVMLGHGRARGTSSSPTATASTADR